MVVNLDILEGNIVEMQKLLNKYKIKNRPRVKARKVPAIARMQINVGADSDHLSKIKRNRGND